LKGYCQQQATEAVTSRSRQTRITERDLAELEIAWIHTLGLCTKYGLKVRSENTTVNQHDGCKVQHMKAGKKQK